MEVYAVFSNEGEGATLMGVFSSKEGAERYVEEKKGKREDIWIETIGLDEPRF